MATAATSKDCRIIDLPRIFDPRGSLTFIENNRQIPFEIKRIYYLYDLSGNLARAGHAHKKLQMFLIATSGSFDIKIDDGRNKMKFHLNHPYYGLYIHPMVWMDIDNFSPGTVCMALVSDFFDENDYCRDYAEFLKMLKK